MKLNIIEIKFYLFIYFNFFKYLKELNIDKS